ncbi:unnamed protein product [Penicillium pancosmium]
MSDDRSTSPISIPNSQFHPLRGSFGVTFTDLFAKQNNPSPASDSQATGFNAPNAEDAVGEDVESASPGATSNSPFARRVSFSAQALRQARAGSIGNGRYPPPPKQPAKAARASESSSGSVSDERSSASYLPTGEGFNWTEALRSLAERASSIGGPISPQGSQPMISQPGRHQQAASVAIMEQPVQEMPKQFKQNRPDFFQEKILRGDFME